MGEARLARAHELRRRAETHIASAGWLSARELLEDSLAVYREVGDGLGESACLRGLGDVARQLDDPEGAAELYRRALEGARAAGDRRGEGEALFRLGDLGRARGEVAPARRTLLEAARTFRDQGHRAGEAQCLGLLAEISRAAAGPPAETLGLYRQAHAIQMEVGDLRGAAVTLTFIANFLKEEDPARAAEAYVLAARIYQGLGLGHRAEPYLAAARRLDPAHAPEPVPRRPGPWDADAD